MKGTRDAGAGEGGAGLIFNIQRFSLHDGSGIRTLVFLKGCPLACPWCSNPEGRSFTPDLAYRPAKCIGTEACGLCMEACREGAISPGKDGKVEIDRTACTSCGLCVEACPSLALERFGKRMTVEEVLGVVEEDGAFYARSGGGLTLSGGEAMSQPRFAVALLRAARARGLGTALETTGLCRWEDLEAACAELGELFFDVKILDPGRHREVTGVENEAILANLKRVCEGFPGLRIVVRTPIVPGFNNAEEEVSAVVDFLNGLARPVEYELLPYHGFGAPKYEQLGLEYALQDLSPPSPERMEALRDRVRRRLRRP